MFFRATGGIATRTGPRMFDRAEGILVALRRCTVDAAFDEIVAASRRYRVPPFSIARALVALAEDREPDCDTHAAAAARSEWAALFDVEGKLLRAKPS